MIKSRTYVILNVLCYQQRYEKKAAVEWVYHFLAAIVPSHKHFHGHILIADSMTIKDPKQKFYEKYFHHL